MHPVWQDAVEYAYDAAGRLSEVKHNGVTTDFLVGDEIRSVPIVDPITRINGKRAARPANRASNV